MSTDKLKAAFAAWVKKNGIVVNGKQELQKIFEHFMKTVVLPQAQAAGGQVLGSDGHHYEIPDDHDTHMVNDGSTVQIVDVDHDANKTYVDDWQQLLRDRAKASIGPNGEMLDDFDQEFELGNIKTAQSQAIAPPANTNPPSSITAILGGQATVTPGCSPIEVARWQGEDSESTNVSVTAGNVIYTPTIPPGAPVVGQCNPFAIVSWGTRGFALRAEVDVGNGVQFTIGASFVSLSLSADVLQQNVAANQHPVPANATAMMSFRQVEHSGALITRTIRDYNFASGAVNYLVPAFARTFNLIFGNVPDFTATFQVTFHDGNGQNVGDAILSADAGKSPTIPVPPTANNWKVTLLTGTGAATFMSGVFGLCL